MTNLSMSCLQDQQPEKEVAANETVSSGEVNFPPLPRNKGSFEFFDDR